MENKEARKRCDKQAFPGFVEGLDYYFARL